MGARKPKFDPSAMSRLLDAPQAASKPQEIKPKTRKKKSKPEDPNDYGKGILELYGSGGQLRHDWARAYEGLSPNKKQGTQAHVAYMKIFWRCRNELSHYDRTTPEYEIEYLRIAYQYIDEWRKEWGHIPGWWNYTPPDEEQNND